jgi:hypothetical protein
MPKRLAASEQGAPAQEVQEGTILTAADDPAYKCQNKRFQGWLDDSKECHDGSYPPKGNQHHVVETFPKCLQRKKLSNR